MVWVGHYNPFALASFATPQIRRALARPSRGRAEEIASCDRHYLSRVIFTRLSPAAASCWQISQFFPLLRHQVSRGTLDETRVFQLLVQKIHVLIDLADLLEEALFLLFHVYQTFERDKNFHVSRHLKGSIRRFSIPARWRGWSAGKADN